MSDRFETPQFARYSLPVLTKRVSFWFYAAAILVLVLATNTPLPLLTIYQSEWHFSTGLVTVVYALYAAGVLIITFVAGAASDQVGRKRVLLTSLLLMAFGLVVCLTAPNVWWLLLARIIQGVAVGAGVTASIAGLSELLSDPTEHHHVALAATLGTVLGVAGGPLVAGSLAQFTSAPTITPYAAALILIVPVFIGVLLAPETVLTRTRLRLSAMSIQIPKAILAPFWLATYVELIAFAVAGTFAGLGASFARDLLHVQSHFAAGLVVALLFICSAASQLAGRQLPIWRAMIFGFLCLLAGLVMFFCAITLGGAIAFFGAAAVLGFGHGLAYLGSQELAARIAPAEQRAEVFACYQLGLYFGATVPAIAVGFLARAIGLAPATIAFLAIEAVLVFAGLGWTMTTKSATAIRA